MDVIRSTYSILTSRSNFSQHSRYRRAQQLFGQQPQVVMVDCLIYLACIHVYVQCTVLYAILCKSNQNLIESNVFRELVSRLKTNREAKLYSLIFMIRCILLMIFMLIDMDLSFINKLISLIWVQSTYFFTSYQAVQFDLRKH